MNRHCYKKKRKGYLTFGEGKIETKSNQIKPEVCREKERERQVQASEPFQVVLHPTHKHHSTQLRLVEDQGPKETAPSNMHKDLPTFI